MKGAEKCDYIFVIFDRLCDRLRSKNLEFLIEIWIFSISGFFGVLSKIWIFKTQFGF